MKYCIQAWAATALLICAACTPSQQELPQAGFILPIGQSLSADGLKAEIAVYTAGTSPQLEGNIELVTLREVGGKLFADINLTATPGEKLVRIYLSHASAGILLWVGEWQTTIVGGAAASMGNFIQMASEGDGLQFLGDAHPSITANAEPFGASGQSNIDQICSASDNTCNGAIAVACNANGFGWSENDCAAREINNGMGVCDEGRCDIDCFGSYYLLEGNCHSECGDGIPNTEAGEACDDGAETAFCNADCTLAECGDSTVNAAAGEVCDDGDIVDNACSADCSETQAQDCADTWGGNAAEDDCGICDTDPSNNCVSCESESDSDCPSGNHCDDSMCLLDVATGAGCNEASDCQSGYCADGVCCDGDCSNTCESCLSANTGVSDGTCASVLAGEDPYNNCSNEGAASCGNTGTCNGAGYCAFYPAQAVCAAPACEGGDLRAQGFCNGSGTCDDGTLTTCSNGCSSGECISEAYIPGAPCAEGQVYGESCWPIMPSNITTCYNSTEEVACPGTAGNGTDACAATGFCGQDGQYADRHTASYTCLNAAGEAQGSCPGATSSGEMVKDNLTGLIWQRADLRSGLSWQNAMIYCNNLNDYGGQSDWRLPNPHELKSIVDDSRYYPAVNTSVFPDITAAPYWTSTSYTANSNGAWFVAFSDGNFSYYNKANSTSALCVRGEELNATDHFTESTVHSDAIVTDALTGLVWQKTAATGKTWEEALAYCEAATAAGIGDWRLPTKKELTSLIDFSASNPASEFPDISSSTTYFWSSTTYKGTITKAWGTRFSDGTTNHLTKSQAQSAVCVRTPLRDNLNGTITDSAKGITWMKCAQGMTFNAESNTCEGSNSTFQYCDANDNSCNGGVSGNLLDGSGNSPAWDTCNTSEFAGHTNWRVPNKDELKGLIQCSNGHVVDGDYPARCSDGDGDFTTPAVDTSLFSNFQNTWFWTSASAADNSNGAWGVSFSYGYVTNGPNKDGSTSVLCVR